MKFIVDECTGSAVAEYLRENNFDTVYIHEDTPGMEDDDIIKRAVDEDRIIITNDKDFGELVYHQHQPHRGVILLRLNDDSASTKKRVIKRLLSLYKNKLKNSFTVVTESRVRIRRSDT